MDKASDAKSAFRNSGPKKKRLFTGFGVAMLFVLAFSIFFYLDFKTVVVRGTSMFPEFKPNERLLVSCAYWLVGGYHDGDVVIIRDDSPRNKDGYIIKRIYKMGGETVDWANVPKKWTFTTPYVVPKGMVYVLGDNRDVSEDSRIFGPVPEGRIIGKVIVRPSHSP